MALLSLRLQSWPSCSFSGSQRVGQAPWLSSRSCEASEKSFDFDAKYVLQAQLYGAEGRPPGVSAATAPHSAADASSHRPHHGRQWALLELEEAVTAPAGAAVIGACLGADLGASSC